MKNLAIRQHYIQKFSLSQFAGKKQSSSKCYLKCFDKNNNSFIEEVKYICSESEFYEYNKFQKNYIENRISILEIKANSTFYKILKEYNRFSNRNRRSIYSLKIFNCCVNDIKIIHIFKFMMLQFVRTKKYKDFINNDDLFFEILNDVVNANIDKVKNSCFYKNYKVYMCVNNTNVDLMINDINIYSLKDNSNNNILTYHLNKNIFFVFIGKDKRLDLTVNEELINKINNIVKDTCYEYYFETPLEKEIDKYIEQKRVKK